MSRPAVDQFFLVWCPQSGAPTVRHGSFDEARLEAHRLAVKLPGKEFYILRAVGGYRMPMPGPEPIVIKDVEDGMPF